MRLLPFVLFPTGTYSWQSPKIGNSGTSITSRAAPAGAVMELTKKMPAPKRPAITIEEDWNFIDCSWKGTKFLKSVPVPPFLDALHRIYRPCSPLWSPFFVGTPGHVWFEDTCSSHRDTTHDRIRFFLSLEAPRDEQRPTRRLAGGISEVINLMT